MLAMFAAAVLAATPAQDGHPPWFRSVREAGWTRIDADGDSAAFTRPADGLQLPSRPAVWLRVEYRAAQAPFGYVSSSVLAHIDCEARAYTLSDFSFFPRRNLSGPPRSLPDAQAPSPIAPGSRLAGLSAAACAARQGSTRDAAVR